MSLLKKIIKKLFSRTLQKPITTYPTHSKPIGRALFSYLAQPLLLKPDDPTFYGHSNKWESIEIVKILNDLGFIVDAIDWNNMSFVPTKKYDLVFDIATNLHRLHPFLNESTIKLLHITGSHPRFSNQQEQKRIVNLQQRKNAPYKAKRFIRHIEAFDNSMAHADYCLLIGNDITLHTFPKAAIEKTNLISPSSAIDIPIKQRAEYVPDTKEFLWFGGSGAVHKGLDLVLDIFVKNPNLRLNIIGSVAEEQDFLDIYRQELFHTPNIVYHGFCLPNSDKFKTVVSKSFCFVVPSCSEGISTACTTCMQVGLYPIISRNTGIDLPKNSGTYLENCSLQEIEQQILVTYSLQTKQIKDQINACQTHALNSYSRENFSKSMRSFLQYAVSSKNCSIALKK